MVCIYSIFVQIFIIFGGIYFERRYILRKEAEYHSRRPFSEVRLEAIRLFLSDHIVYVRNHATQIATVSEPELPVQPEILDEHPSIESAEEVGEVEELEWDERLEHLQESNV
jgi:hypothetical protein